jgi:formylglycine-generating enzyme required for sulfatase activity
MTAPIFVSHSSKDVTRVRSLVASLESRGLTCWISERDIAAGDNYGDAIVDAIERAGAMVLVFSENANNSDEIKKEIALASQRRITVVPVRIEDVTPSKAFRYELATRNWIDLFPNWAEGLGRLSERLATILDAPRVVEIAPSPVKSRPTRPFVYVATGVAAGVLALGVAAATLLPRGPTSQTAPVAERSAATGAPLSSASGDGRGTNSPTPAPSPAPLASALPSQPPAPAIPIVAPSDTTVAPTPLAIASTLPSPTPSPAATPVVRLETPSATPTPVAPKPSAAIETTSPTPSPVLSGSPSPVPLIAMASPTPAPTAPVESSPIASASTMQRPVSPTAAEPAPSPVASAPPSPTPTTQVVTPAPDVTPAPPATVVAIAPPLPSPVTTASPMLAPSVASVPSTTVASLAPQTYPNPEPSPAPSVEAALTPPVTLPTGIRVGPAPRTAANDPGGEVFKECDECPEMVVVPAGKASLGSPRGELGRDDRNEAEPHQVSISRPFAIGRYAVTVAEWKACVADGGCGSRLPGNMGFDGDRRPVIFVSWNDAQAFVGWLNKKTSGRYRLPSEAEWEFATRGCARQECDAKPFWFGKITPENAVYDRKFSYDGSPKAYLPLQTEAVDWGAPNPFGLYNMLGNVRQWTLDCWNPSSGANHGDGAPILSGDCSERVTRGGSWNEKPSKLRAGARAWAAADDRTSPNIGFRVLRELAP